jgi:hypothetical protein
MTEQQYTQYIIDQLKYLSGDHQGSERLAYQVGFLAAQLASAMSYDSHCAERFRRRIRKLGYTTPA